MPGYGIAGAGDGTGLLPWSWAEEKLRTSRNYWVSTVCPDGRPHSMPVWGVWDAVAASLWFSCSVQSRKARNLAAEPRCVVAIEDATDPVVVDGTAEIVTDRAAIGWFLGAMNQKYETGLPDDFLDPAVNASVRIRPRSAFGLLHEDFTGSPTHWTFP
jgi:PPOX class probable F420-dependent enzyme